MLKHINLWLTTVIANKFSCKAEPAASCTIKTAEFYLRIFLNLFRAG